LFKLQPTSPLFSQHENILQSLTTSIQDLHDDLAAHPPPDYLFFASLTYVYRLLFWNRDIDAKIIKTDIRQNLILAILQYHAHATQLRTVIKEGFYNTCGNFEEDWLEFVQAAEKLGVVLPPPGVQPPTDPSPLQEEPHQRAGDAIVEVGADSLSERPVQGTASTPPSLKMGDNNPTAT